MEVGLTRDRLLVDAGVAYLKAAEEAEGQGSSPEEIKGLLINSQGFLLKVKALDREATDRNLVVVKTKLKTMEIM